MPWSRKATRMQSVSITFEGPSHKPNVVTTHIKKPLGCICNHSTCAIETFLHLLLTQQCISKPALRLLHSKVIMPTGDVIEKSYSLPQYICTLS